MPNERKHFMDNIKMIAFRAETAMFHLIKNQLNRHHQGEGRKLLQEMYNSDAGLIPDYLNKTLTVRIHNLNHHKNDKILKYLCGKLNETQTRFPGTNLRLVHDLVSS